MNGNNTSSDLNSLERKLNFYKKIEAMIQNQATGYEIAYEIEENKEELEEFPPKKPFSGKIFFKKYKKISDLFHLVRDYKRDIIPLDSPLVNIIRVEIDHLEEELDYLKFKKEKRNNI